MTPEITLITTEFNPLYEAIIDNFMHREGNMLRKRTDTLFPQLRMHVTLHNPNGSRLCLPAVYTLYREAGHTWEGGHFILSTHWRTPLDRDPSRGYYADQR